MAILGPAFAVLGRYAGKLLNTLFGWATVTLFGRVPEGRQLHVSIIALGSVLWMVVLIGIAFPRFGAWVLSFVPIPDFVDPLWVRLAMLAAAGVIQLIVGGISLLMLAPEQRPKDAAGKVKVVLKGYPYTLGLSVSLLMMLVFVPFLKIGPMLKRMTSVHVPVLVASEDYGRVVQDVQGALGEAGWKTQRRPASWLLKAPTKVLTFFAAGAIENMVAKNMTTLHGKEFQVMLHPADLVIVGKKATVRQARSVLAEAMAFSDAHLTWSKTANELEDELTAIARSAAGQAEVPYEEWEVLFRNKLLVERSLLQAEHGPTVPWASPETMAGQVPAAAPLRPAKPPLRRRAGRAIGAALASAVLNALRGLR